MQENTPKNVQEKKFKLEHYLQVTSNVPQQGGLFIHLKISYL